MQTQTIAQLKAAIPSQSLWDYLWQIPNSVEAQIFYALMIASLLGIVAHYLRLWASGQIAGSLWDYLFTQHPRNTFLAILGAASLSVGEVSANLYQSAWGDVLSWAIVFVSGFKNGYATDSLINKFVRAEWTDEQRAKQQSAVQPQQGV